MNGDRPLVAVLDYGIGNLRSAQKALERVGADARLTADAALIRDAAGVVLPGVGHFGTCMDQLRLTGLEQPALEAIERGRPFLGICVGMQMLFEASEGRRAFQAWASCPGLCGCCRTAWCDRRCSGTASMSADPAARCCPD